MNSPFFNIIGIQLKEFIREPEVLFWAVLFPILISGVLGLAFANKGDTTRTVAVITEQPGSNITEKYKLPAANGTDKFNYIGVTENEASVKLKRGEISLFIKGLENGKPVYYFDPKNPEAQLTYLLLEKQFNESKTNPGSVVQITSKGDRYIDFLIPGLLGLGIMNSCIWGIGWALIDFRIKKLLRRMVATPMKKSTFLLAHISTRLTLSFMEGMLLFLFAYLAFGVEMQGSVAAAILVFITGIIAFAGIAVLTSSRAKNAQVGNGLINAVVLPFTILSGIFFSYHNFPAWAQDIIQYLPLTMLADSLRSIFNEGAGISQVAFKAGLLSIIGVVFFIIGLKNYKWY